MTESWNVCDRLTEHVFDGGDLAEGPRIAEVLVKIVSRRGLGVAF